MRGSLQIPSTFGDVSGGVNGRPFEGDHGWSKWYLSAFKQFEWNPFSVLLYWPSKQAIEADPADVQPSRGLIAGRRPVEYDDSLRNEKVLVMPTRDDLRYLGPAAGMAAFQGGEFGEMAQASRRFQRDALHWHPNSFEVAAIVIAQLGGAFSYASMHIRRGDLQYETSKTDAATTMRNIAALVPSVPGSPKPAIYMATDENDHAFFDALHEKYTIYQFRDFFEGAGGNVLKRYAKEHGIDRRRVGQIEMIICAAGSRFIGSESSTFSAEISKLHGYLGAPDTNMYYHTKKMRPKPAGKVARKERVAGQTYMVENAIQWEEV
eukprot:TRINITY_DN10144_c0_g1_i1.p1 TRINITY_DN10144_c0_g1~~TRINITY_DN10144_c0_g1_i1.p1  ORF type:complete len:321 (+),score=37.33 TRINITY_DN10144_c0_g1_i1:383-1345(+)